MQLHDEALEALKDCLTLIAWQLELIDQKTGQLSLDETEQATLIEAFALQVGQSQFRPPVNARPFSLISYSERQA
ncbi:hypothetical protein D9M71_779770 [compost metagenome]